MKAEIQILSRKRCIIGEGPVWNEKEQKLYHTNGYGGNELCVLDVYTGESQIRPLEVGCAAYAFGKNGELLVSRKDGVWQLREDDTVLPLYDRDKYDLSYSNDMKVGPDGRIYVGTQSTKRLGLSDRVDGKLFSIDKDGTVRKLLDGLILSNGLEWSMDEKRLYHTDSDTGMIREYEFDKKSGDISSTGRAVFVPGVDGFTMDVEDRIFAACWGKSRVAVIDTKSMEITDEIRIPAAIPASCGFAGKNLEYLCVVTAEFNGTSKTDPNAGYTFLCDIGTRGRTPYLFG